MKVLGVIGGMGPMATAYFMRLVIEMTAAERDQNHIEMIVYNCPAVPDRTACILGQSSDSPLPQMTDIGRKLVTAGAEVVAIPCMTAHYFHDALQEEIGVPIIHGIEETVLYMKRRGVRRVGIMATDGTVQTGLFRQALEKQGMQCIVPSAARQKDVMHLIYNDVKAGRPVEKGRFDAVSQELFGAGAEVIVLGCTELSMVKRDFNLGKGYLDVLDVLAKCSVERCGTLRPEYEELITK